jgi:hypothetical protein
MAAGICIAFEPLQFSPHVGGMLITQIAILLQSPIDDVFQFHWDIRIKAYRRHGSAVQNGLKDRP